MIIYYGWCTDPWFTILINVVTIFQHTITTVRITKNILTAYAIAMILKYILDDCKIS
jgi:hypothetical protein